MLSSWHERPFKITGPLCGESTDDRWIPITSTSDFIVYLWCMMTSSNGTIFPRYWLFVRGIHRSPVNSPHKGQWRGALMFSLICVWINDWVNNREAGDLRRQRAHSDVSVMVFVEVSLNKLFNKQSNYRWFETPWRSCLIIVVSSLVLKINF